MEYTIIDVTQAPLDVLRQIANMKLKPIDAEECLYMGAESTEQAIGTGIATSQFCQALIDDAGEPQAVYGVVDTPAGFSVPWLLTTSEHKITKSWLRMCKDTIFPLMCEDRNFMTNMCFSDNVATKRWLKFMGFYFKKYDDKCDRFMQDVTLIQPEEDIINV